MLLLLTKARDALVYDRRVAIATFNIKSGTRQGNTTEHLQHTLMFHLEPQIPTRFHFYQIDTQQPPLSLTF